VIAVVDEDLFQSQATDNDGIGTGVQVLDDLGQLQDQ
jgi:hypothetical protein